MVKTNCSTLRMVYNIQQSATQGSNDTTHRLSRRTAATTRFSPDCTGCQKQTALRFLPTSCFANSVMHPRSSSRGAIQVPQLQLHPISHKSHQLSSHPADEET